MGEHMGIYEIATALEKEPEEVHMMHHRGKLPPPDDTIGNGRTKLWHRDTIEQWIQEELT